MSKKTPQELVLEISALLGNSAATRLLVVAGISPHTAIKMLSGSYPHKVNHLTNEAVHKAYRAAIRQAAKGA